MGRALTGIRDARGSATGVRVGVQPPSGTLRARRLSPPFSASASRRYDPESTHYDQCALLCPCGHNLFRADARRHRSGDSASPEHGKYTITSSFCQRVHCPSLRRQQQPLPPTFPFFKLHAESLSPGFHPRPVRPASCGFRARETLPSKTSLTTPSPSFFRCGALPSCFPFPLNNPCPFTVSREGQLRRRSHQPYPCYHGCALF